MTPGAAVLTVSESGDGTVTSSPPGINCGPAASQCSVGFPPGQVVSLTATPGAGSAFAGWGGACSGTGGCALTLTSDTTVTASFAALPPPTSTLSIVPAGTGSGTVSSNPSGISCGMTCSASFQTGTQIVISAAAAANSTFAGWSGGGCVGITPCAVTLDANTIISANFVQNQATAIQLFAAVLPTSRSVQVGTPATAFATIVNAGPGDATTCTISPQTGQPASFVFQTTDPNTNSLTGTANTPADIPQGGSQSFVFAFTPNAPFGPREIALVYSCANGPRPATTMVGLNTLNLSASPVPVPDIVAVLASTDPGYVIITPTTNTGVFAVAASNVGIADTITASVDSGTANLPVTFTICQADFATRACVAAPAATVTLPIGARRHRRVRHLPARQCAGARYAGDQPAFVRFTDSTGTLRGAASVAVRTGGGGGGGGDGGTASARPRPELLRRGPLKLTVVVDERERAAATRIARRNQLSRVFARQPD